MKNFIIYKIFIFILIYNIIINSTELVTNIARKMDYYELINELRLKTTLHWEFIRKSLDKEILKLQQKKRYIKANKLKDEYHKALAFYDLSIKKIFNYLDEIIVEYGHKLDEYNANVEEKIKFIQKLKIKALFLIDKILNKNVSDIKKLIYF